MAPTPFGEDGVLGGGERYPLELARAIAREVDCELLTFGTHASTARDPSGLQVTTLKAWHWLGGHPAQALTPELPAALGNATVVHAHHMRAAPSRLAALAGRVAGLSLVVTDHGCRGGDWGGLLQRLFHRFLPVSHYSARELAAPAARTRVIYGGADTRRFRPDANGNRRGVLYVGRVTPHKGIDVLIEALPPDATLVVAGSSGHDPQMPEKGYPELLAERAAGKNVRFLGPVDEQTLPLLYRQAEVVVLPSVARTCYGKDVPVSELLGLALLEAMASATAVICTRIGGLPETVSDGVTGFVVEPGDRAELEARLRQLLGDRRLARRFGERGRELVHDRFTWTACAHRCLATYSELGA